MRIKQIVGGPISAMLLLSVPVLALLALSPWSTASRVRAANPIGDVAAGELTAGGILGGASAAGDRTIDELSDWQYTGKSMKSAKSEKSKKSPKSKKSHKSQKSKKPSKKH